MIRYVTHKNIDTVLWDSCISGSGNGLVYALSWYLDIVSPQWDALIMDNYRTVMPLTWKKKLGLKYLVQPVFSQQLGVFGNDITLTVIEIFLKSIPKKFVYVKICLNSSNNIRNPKFPVQISKNHELSLAKDYAALSANFSYNNSNNIRVSGKRGLRVKESTQPGISLDLIKQFISTVEGGVNIKINNILDKLIHELLNRKACLIYDAYTASGELCSSVVFIHFMKRWFYLLSASNKTGRKNKVSFLVLDTLIREHCSTDEVLDFEGSNIESIAYIFKGFGAVPVEYYRLSFFNLPGF